MRLRGKEKYIPELLGHLMRESLTSLTVHNHLNVHDKMGKPNSGSVTNHSHTTPEIVIINCVVNAPLMLISILGNALVLTAITRTPSIRSTPHMIMLCSLAVSDFLVGLIAQPIYIAQQLTEDDLAYHVWRLLGSHLCVVSLLTITAIAMDRFLALHYHMRYATLVTESRVKYTLIIIWLTSLVAPVFHVWNERIYQLSVGSIIAISLVISTLSYIGIYRIVRRHQLHIKAKQQAVQSFNAGNNLNIARLKRSAMNTFVFYIALIICYFPMYLLLTLHGLSYVFWQMESEFAITLVLSNSCINPLLYCWRLRELRTAVVKTAKKILCKETEEN